MTTAIRLILELVLSCHCQQLVTTEHGLRCAVLRDHPRCEFVDGVHVVTFGTLVCTKGCEE